MIDNVLHSKFRFFVNYPTGQEQVYPVNKTLEVEWAKDDEYRYYRRQIETPLIFTNDTKNATTDFDSLYAHDRSLDGCEPLPITIEKKCDDTWQLYYEGRLNMVDATFDVERCRVEVPMRPDDEWACIEENFKEEYNVLEISNRYVAKTSRGQLERITLTCGDLVGCSTPYNDPLTTGLAGVQGVVTLDLTEGWTLEYHFGTSAGQTTRWVRRFVNSTTSPGAGWVEVETGKWVTSVDMRFESEFDNGVENEQVYVLALKESYRNARLLSEVIEFMFEECEVDVVSDFYGVNPDDTAPDNDYYDTAPDQIFVFQKSDIKRPDAINAANRLPFTIEALFNHVRNVHNVYPFFKDGVLRLEHISYRDSEYTMDLTQESLQHLIKGRHSYSYDVDKLPKKERWRWMDEYTDIDFAGTPITYSSCFTSRDNDEVDYAMNYLTTDIASIAADPDNAQDEGMVWLLIDEDDYMVRDTGALTGTPKLNAGLSIANLLRDFHTIGRPQRIGKLNGEDTVFVADPVRTQAEIILPICCADINEFNPNDKIKTQLGWGEVESAELVEPIGKLTLNLKHNA